MTNLFTILFPLVTLLAPPVQADNANEEFKEKLVVTFLDQGAGQSQQYYWADHTQYKTKQEKKDLSFERGEDWDSFNALTFERKTDGDPQIIYFDQGLGDRKFAYNCTVSITGTPLLDKISWDLTASPLPGKENSASNVVDFQCVDDKVEIPPAPLLALLESAPTTLASSSSAAISSELINASPTDSQASSAAKPSINPPIADFSNPFNGGEYPVILTFLSKNKDPRIPGWLDTTIYDYAADGKTDKYKQAEDMLWRGVTDDGIRTSSRALGQMKFTNTPAKYRTYSWQEDIKEKPYFNCNFTITEDPDVSDIFFWLEHDDKNGNATGKKDGEYVDDAKNEEIRSKISVSCEEFGKDELDQVDNQL